MQKSLHTMYFLYFMVFSYCGNIYAVQSETTLSNSEIQILIEEAKVLEENSEKHKALDVYNKALQLASDKELLSEASFIYKKIGLIHYGLEDYSKALLNFKMSIQKDSLSKNAADSHFNIALVFRKQKQEDSLLFYLNKSLYTYNLLEDSEDKFNTYSKAGILFKNNGNYETAITYLLKAYEGFELLGDNNNKDGVCNTIAATQRLLGNLDIAKQYYMESLRLRKQTGDSIKVSFAYNNLANLYKDQKSYDSAIVYYTKAIDIQNHLKKTRELGRFLYNLGSVYFLQDDYPRAEMYYKRSVNVKRKEKDSLSLANSYNELALVAIKRGEYSDSKKYLDSASASLNPVQNKDILLRHYEIQVLYYKAIKDYERALSYQEMYTSLYQTLFQEQQAKRIQELQEHFENEKKLQKISELTEHSTVQKAVISKQERDIRARNLLLIISGILLLLAVSIYYLFRQKQKVKAKEIELQQLQAIFKGQEIIKEQISKDLHDIVTTGYDGIRLKILALPKMKAIDKVSQDIVSEIQQINEQIRLISHRLSPLGNKIKNTRLCEIIVAQLSEFQYYRKIFIDIQLPLPEEFDRFHLEAQTNLYGIILEALSNIEKHSRATEVKITHQKNDDNTIEFLIADNGIGYEEIHTHGIGHINMKQRAQLLKGQCVLTTSDVGTTVKLIIPIQPNIHEK